MLLSVVQLSGKCFRGLNVAKVTSASSYIQVQKYSRFTSRRPVAIVNEDELFEDHEAAYPIERENPRKDHDKFYQNEKSSNYSHRNSNTEHEKVDYSGKKRTYPKRRNNFKENEKTQKLSVENAPELEEDTVPSMKIPKNKSQPKVDTSTKNTYTKLYENEKLLSNLMLEIKSRRKRKSYDRVLLEGTRLITDAIQAGEIPEIIIFSNADEMKKLPLPEKDVKLYKVPYRTIQLWSSLTTTPGIMGVFKTPNIENYESPNSLPITIICDKIRDPGNMGSILRAAAGVGCEKIILTKGCVDLWESKVLRSAAGAHFRLPIFSYKEWNEIRSLVSNDAKIVVADNKVVAEESLVDENDSEGVEEVSNIEKENRRKDGEFVNKRNKHEKVDSISEIPVVPYFSLDYTQGETVIIIGGETEGLSEETFRLVDDAQGIRVNVPLNNGVESLNSGMALGVIAFEIKRQFLIAANKVK
ncbi:rRNA methyltransferase 3, mitochondrial isoform X2 [Belonocnema kinseyi]|uniref:rRNA methyltransferase 3, mitochondrial isoform X2 n=1 Tax=Belonocnema kinseyi TaxID=2817044 RepID=UPI00143D6E5D|nr:rRNA methyltransferase 3, mitochondrial isoform X2 [Belonocnema kinseyi]